MYDGLFLPPHANPRSDLVFSTRESPTFPTKAFCLFASPLQITTTDKQQTNKNPTLSLISQLLGRIVYFRRVPWRPLCFLSFFLLSSYNSYYFSNVSVWFLDDSGAFFSSTAVVLYTPLMLQPLSPSS